MTGKADFYSDGQWNFYCDFCGAKTKSGEGTRTWDNFYVCKHHKEERNPQDFVRGVRENQSLPWTRPEPPEIFAPVCVLQGQNAIPGYAVPGCTYPGFVNVLFIQIAPTGTYTQQQIALAAPFFSVPYIPPQCSYGGSLSIPGWAVPGCSIPHTQPDF